MRQVHFASFKWPDTPHWEFDARWLGADAIGHWLGLPEGTWLSRPGAGFHAQTAQVVLVPHDQWWCATFHDDLDPRRPVDTYVDIATPATWEADTVTCVDLDLDLIKGTSGRVWVDDEDEFAQHRSSLGYSPDMVDRALSACAEVQHLMEVGEPPFDRDTGAGWMAKLRQTG